jgi:AcrR family transcriptional regulator
MARRIGIDRQQVLRVAAELADIHGFSQLTLAQVAEQLGIRLPSLYNHVQGLDDVRRELALLGLQLLKEQLMLATVGKAHDDAVMALGHAYRAFVLRHPGLYAATVQAPPADDQELQQQSAAAINLVLTILVPYQLDHDAAIHAVRGLRSIAHGFATLEQAGGFGLPLDCDESYTRLLQTFVIGLRH